RTFTDILPLLDRDFVALDLDPVRLATRLSGTKVELPAVPGAAQDFIGPGKAVLARLVRLDQADQTPFAKAAALVGAAVQNAEQLAVDVEDGDRAALDGDELATAGRQVPNRGDDVATHLARPYTFRAFSKKNWRRRAASTLTGRA